MWRFFYSIYGNQFEVHKRPNMGPLTHSGLNGLQTTAATFLQKEPFCDPAGDTSGKTVQSCPGNCQ